jgi:tetratricopeptide (TPR) repeat protein
MLALSQGRFEDAEAQLLAALSAARDIPEPAIESGALAALGRRAVLVAAPDATAICEDAIASARAIDDPLLVADALLTFAGACERNKDWERAQAITDEALEIYRSVGDAYGAAWALAEQGWYHMVHGRLHESERRLGEALELRRKHGDDRRLVEPLIDYAWLLLALNHGEAARRGFFDCLALARHVGDQFIVGEALAGLSTEAARDGRWADAARLAGASAALHEQIGAPPWESVTVIQGKALAAAREALGSDYEGHYAEGRELSPERAVARLQNAAARPAVTSIR